jgi:hypothetical protein
VSLSLRKRIGDARLNPLGIHFSFEKLTKLLTCPFSEPKDEKKKLREEERRKRSEWREMFRNVEIHISMKKMKAHRVC